MKNFAQKIKTTGLITTLTLGSIMSLNAQDIIQDEQNTSGHAKNEFIFRVGTIADYSSNHYKVKGISLGDYTQQDYTLNMFYPGHESSSYDYGFNIYTQRYGGTKKVFSLDRYGNTVIGGDQLKFHDDETLNLPVSSTALKSINYSGPTTDRWLQINPKLWSSSLGKSVNGFSLGTYLNSRVLISDAYHSHTPPTLNSDALLSVDGKIYSEGLKCQMSEDWADYVFKKDYKLKPLFEVENFINANGHLPNIPSAETIEKEGLDVTDMQRLQMEKIEELTLYLIDSDKEKESLKEENELMKQRLADIEAKLDLLMSK